MHLPTISIVVPVYNAEKYLSHCLESLANQTYKNIEIICVNDGSSDNSLEILKKYASSDSRFKIFSQENSGVSVARNTALDNVSGKYIMFVDSDDWIDPDTCEIALNAITEHNIDLVMWDYMKDSVNSSIPKNIFETDIFFTKTDVAEKLHRCIVGPVGAELSHPEKADALSSACCKLYKTEVIQENNIRFYDIRKIGSFEDGLFNLHVFEKTSTALYLNKPLYHYRRNYESVTRTFRANLQAQHENIHSYLKAYISEHRLNDIYTQALNNRIAFELIGYGLNILLLPKKRVRQIKQILKNKKYSTSYKQLTFKYFPIHWKIFYLCAKYKFAFGVYILLLFIKKITRR